MRGPTIWQLQPHTRAKHAIFERYLKAWIPILSRAGNRSLRVIDGFAGPGRYEEGELGSPIVALQTAANIDDPRDRQTRIEFLFIELDRARGESLVSEINALNLPANLRPVVEVGKSFEEVATGLLDSIEHTGETPPPTFAFLDPFWVDVPYGIVKRILAFNKGEVLINFMYGELNRFLEKEDQYPRFEKLFDGPEWRKAQTILDPVERKRFLHDLYRKLLLRVAKYVWSFEMRNNHDVTDYFLFYATNSFAGLKEMKRAMWKVDSTGSFLFSDATDPNQLYLLGDTNADAVQGFLVSQFSGNKASILDIEHFVVSETPFLDTHYKPVLKAMEAQGKVIPINANPTRRKGTYADPRLILKFA